jgi:hypothetical protein
MWVRTVSRNMAVAGALVVTGVGFACDPDHGSLTAPANPEASVSVKGVQQNYIWQLSWTGSPGCGFTWDWQLGDGSTIAGGFAGCAPPLSGTGTIPATATAIIVTASLSEFPADCGAFETVTKPVNTSQNVSVSIKISVPKKTSVLGITVDCPPASADFSLSN